jgi:hypothetical protein
VPTSEWGKGIGKDLYTFQEAAAASDLPRCRDSILYRLVLAYFTAHDDWASQYNITIMCRAIPYIMHSFPAITRQTQDTFPHSHNAFPRSRIFAFHRASSRSITHLRVLAHLRISLRIFAFSRIFAFHRASSHPRASSRFIAHLRIPLQFSAHHRRSIHPLSSQFLGASQSIYYYI